MSSLFGLTTLLGLTSTKFGTAERSGVSGGALDFNRLSNNYGMNILKYPLDIGDYPRGHYMIIHINEQVKTQFSTSQRGGQVGGTTAVSASRAATAQMLGGSTNAISATAIVGKEIAKAGADLSGKAANYIQGKSAIADQAVSTISSVGKFVDSFIGLGEQAPGIQSSINSAVETMSSDSFLRTIRRTTESIVLYMPNSVATDISQSYSTPSIGGTKIGAGVGAATAAGAGKEKEAIANMAPFLAEQLSRGDALYSVAFSGATGTVANPQLEVLYQSPSLRTFQFDFLFYPRSQKEAEEVQKILTSLMFHQSPEILGASAGGGQGGYFMVPPSEFDIQFYYNGKENPNVQPISTCVLTEMKVDYTESGEWHAYEVETDLISKIGGSGMPVSIRLTLGFMETEMFTKSRIRNRMNQLNSFKQDEGYFDP